MSKRAIIQIDEEKCNGCGQCILACAEGALQLIDGKARLVSETYCDGLGACLGECPTGALTIIEREAPEFDAEAVDEHLKKLARPPEPHHHAHEPVRACPSAAAMHFHRPPTPAATGAAESTAPVSELGHWPVKLQLLSPAAPFLQNADLVLAADCVPFAFPDFHRRILAGKAVAIGCPKLDDLEAHIHRLAEIIRAAEPRSLTVVHMEVPCCFGFVHAAKEALKRAGSDLELNEVVISRQGQILETKPASPRRAAAGR